MGAVFLGRFCCRICTVEPLLKDYTILSLKISDLWWEIQLYRNMGQPPFCQEDAVLQERWSLMAVVSQDRFHCKTCLLWCLKQ